MTDLGSEQHALQVNTASDFGSTPRYMPTVASFIPNLPLGSPLKVSIHSWEPPVASADTRESVKDAGQIYFEARVLIDGVCIAYVVTTYRFIEALLMNTMKGNPVRSTAFLASSHRYVEAPHLGETQTDT